MVGNIGNEYNGSSSNQIFKKYKYCFKWVGISCVEELRNYSRVKEDFDSKIRRAVSIYLWKIDSVLEDDFNIEEILFWIDVQHMIR